MNTKVSLRWIGLLTVVVGLALYQIVKIGEEHDYTVGKVVMLIGCAILLSRYALKSK